MIKNNKNKLYTLSYFKKRLKDSGIISKPIIREFDKNDKRYWLLSIDPKHKILCTCFKYTENNEMKYSFRFSDGHQRIPIDKTITTESMLVIINELKKVIGNE